MVLEPEQICPLVWVVDSAYTGELHARIGLAERLGYGYELIPIPNGDIPAYEQTLLNLYQQEGNSLQPLLIINGTGEETTSEIANLRRLFGRRLFTVFLASILPDEHHPRLAEYDLIASPQLSGDNIVSLVGVPHHLTQEGMNLAHQQHADYFNSLSKPIIGVLVGGNTRYCNGFDEVHARHFAERVAKVGYALEASLVITNSRRTPANALSVLLQGLSGLDCHFFDWQHIDSLFYTALLAHADIFVVSGDSLSMCSEAAFTGKPLLVDLSNSATECYHRQIVGQMIDYGAAKLLTDSFEPWSYTPLDPTASIVTVIKQRLAENVLNFRMPH
jgi:mitochondrial fission protein ELM1